MLQMSLVTWDRHPGIGPEHLVVCFQCGQLGQIRKDCLLLMCGCLDDCYSQVCGLGHSLSRGCTPDYQITVTVARWDSLILGTGRC